MQEKLLLQEAESITIDGQDLKFKDVSVHVSLQCSTLLGSLFISTHIKYQKQGGVKGHTYYNTERLAR